MVTFRGRDPNTLTVDQLSSQLNRWSIPVSPSAFDDARLVNSVVVIETGEVMFEGPLQSKSRDGDRMFSSWRGSVVALRRFIFWGWLVGVSRG